MATMVGTQKSFTQAIKELVELDYDALGAYESAINNLENPEHITELSAFLSRCNETAPSGPDNMKKVLVKGKVELASLFGDQNILSAMLSNEEDTNTAYERINARIGEAADKEIAKIIAGGLADERKHRDWIQSNISQQDK
jgi:hypothetical protein